MKSTRSVLVTLALAVFFALPPALAQEEKEDNVAGPYVPTPWVIVDELLKLADIGPNDVVYDLGSGDGRLVITAATRYGARGVGVELQRKLVELAGKEAERQGVASRVRFIEGDLFETSLKDASVVTLYLLPRFVTRLVPKLRAELAPGTRIVSHDYPLTPWPADKTLTFDVDEKEPITGSKRTSLYYYRVPAQVGGAWVLSLPAEFARAPLALEFQQGTEGLEGVARAGSDTLNLRDPVVRGESIRFGLLYRGRLLNLTGKVSGEAMSGEVTASGSNARERWSAHFRGPSAR